MSACRWSSMDYQCDLYAWWGGDRWVASVARRYKLAAASVADWNDVKANAAFKVGQQVVVYLPVQAAQAHASSAGKRRAAAPPVRRGGSPAKKRR